MTRNTDVNTESGIGFVNRAYILVFIFEYVALYLLWVKMPAQPELNNSPQWILFTRIFITYCATHLFITQLVTLLGLKKISEGTASSLWPKTRKRLLLMIVIFNIIPVLITIVSYFLFGLEAFINAVIIYLFIPIMNSIVLYAAINESAQATGDTDGFEDL